MSRLSLFIFLTYMALAESQYYSPSLDRDLRPLYRLSKSFVFNLTVNAFGTGSQKSRQILRKMNRLQDYIPPDKPFPCDRTFAKSKEIPESVHKLRVGDVDVIGALGDSLTAGFGLAATNLFELVIEDRGHSFSIGGQDDWRTFFTIPNILKEFNPKLVGYSLGPSVTTQRKSQFNVAEGGAVSREIPYMAEVLYLRLISDPRVNIKKDWKMINIFIGNNDFCDTMCLRRNPFDVLEDHKKDLYRVLRFFKEKLPRTIINLVPPPNLNTIADAKQKPLICEITQRMLCPCLVENKFKNVRPQFERIMKLWQLVEVDVANNAEFDTDDFTVVAQPFFMSAIYPSIIENGRERGDFSYTAPDCFHFSQKGTAIVALNFWNSLLEPVGRKNKFDFKLKKFNCPGPNTFIATRRNSAVSQ